MSTEDELAKKLIDDLLAVNYHSTDVEACHLHEKHTPQCYGCRHAKWDVIIKTELRDRFDCLTVVNNIEEYVATERRKAADEARFNELKHRVNDIFGRMYRLDRAMAKEFVDSLKGNN